MGVVSCSRRVRIMLVDLFRFLAFFGVCSDRFSDPGHPIPGVPWPGLFIKLCLCLNTCSVLFELSGQHRKCDSMSYIGTRWGRCPAAGADPPGRLQPTRTERKKKHAQLVFDSTNICLSSCLEVHYLLMYVVSTVPTVQAAVQRGSNQKCIVSWRNNDR